MTAHLLEPATSGDARHVGGGRVRRAVITWSTGMVYTVTTLVVGLVATPLLLKFLGVERVGAYRVAGEWVGYLTLADLGLGAAFNVLIVRALTSGDPRQTTALAKAALRLLSFLMLFSLPLGLALAWHMPRLVKVPAAMETELRVASLLAVAAVAFAPLSIFRTVLEAAQRGYLVHGALLAQSLVITGLSLLLAWAGWGLVGQGIAALLGFAVYAGLAARWGAAQLSGFGSASVAAARVRPRQLWGLGWPLAAASAGNRLNLMTDSIVVGYLLGPSRVTAMFLTQRIILLAAGQVGALSNSTWAALVELRATGQSAVFQARVVELSRLIVGAGIVLVGTVAAYDVHFVRLWVGASLYGGDAFCVLTVLSAVTFAFMCLFSWLIDAHGDTRHRLPVSTAGSILNLALSIICVQRFGLPGVAAGTLVAYLLTDAWRCPYLVCRHYHVDGWLIVGGVARGLALGLPWAAAVWLLARSHVPPAGWAGFAVEAAASGLAALTYCWLVLLTARDRDEWRGRARRLLPGRRQAALP